MTIDEQRLKKALSKIHEDKIGYFRSCRFVDLTNPMCWDVVREKRHNEAYNYILLINRHIQSIETIVFRLFSQKDLYTRKCLDINLWMKFSALDIELFHVKLRSIFDHLAKTIGLISGTPEQVPDSFRKLKNTWLNGDNYAKNAQKIGTDLAQFVLSCEWFDDLKGVRDKIVHNVVYTLVFPKEGKILFQVHETDKNKVSRKVLRPEVMFNKNVVDFELYAGLYIGYLIAYLEEFSEIVYRRLNLNKLDGRCKNYHPGLNMIRCGIKRMVDY